MCWKLPYALWMIMGLTPFVGAGLNMYFDGWRTWLAARWYVWIFRAVVTALFGTFALVSGVLWLSPCYE